MSTLSPAARALLDAAKGGLSPDAAALHRVRAKIDAAVAGPASTTSSATTAVLGKLAVVLGIATAIAVLVAMRRPEHARAPTLAFTSALAHEPAAERRVHDDPPPATTHIEMQPAAAPRVRRSLQPTIDLAREVELVDAAMVALARRDPTAALGYARQHRAETRERGQLAEDAAAIEIEALCRLHDRRTAAKLDAFDARWPRSAQRARLTSTCP